MELTDSKTAKIRFDWGSQVGNVLQAAVDDLLDGEPGGPTRVAGRLIRQLPAPANEAESSVLRERLLRFVDEASAFNDRRFHARFEPKPCARRVPPECRQDWLDPGRDIGSLVRAWTVRYESWFGTCHAIPAALRARQWIDAHPGRRPSIEQLARFSGASKTTLETQYRKYFGMSVAEHGRRVTAAEGLRRIRSGGKAIDEIASGLDYRSVNKFYARLVAYFGVRPSEVRSMDQAAFEALLAHPRLRR